MILVTGGAGFIGSQIVAQLLDAGYGVRVLDNFHPAAHSGPSGVDERAELVVGDVCDPETVAAALSGVSHVCHQAAMVGLGSDILDIADYVRNNDLGTAVLLRALAASSFGGRFVLASSMVVYGEGRYSCAEHGIVRPGPRRVEDLDAGQFEPPCPECGQALEALSVPEDAPVDPRNVYAASKLQQEHLAFAFSRETGVPVTALRYHNVYGPGMPRDTPYAGVASIFKSSLQAGESPRVFEDGGQIRDFVHVRDVARANVLALTGEQPVAGAFNVCSGKPKTVGDMAFALHGALVGDGAEVHAMDGSNQPAISQQAPPPTITGEYRLGDVRHVFADPSLAAEKLGFVAREAFEDGMREFAFAPQRGE